MEEQDPFIPRKGQSKNSSAIPGKSDRKAGDGVVVRTAGMLKSEGLYLTIEEERDAMERAIAEEVEQRGATYVEPS